MPTPVYQQSYPAQNRPMGRLDSQGRVIPSTYDDLAYVGDLDGGSTLIYEGWGRPGTAQDEPEWKICKHTYSGTTLIQTQWPINGSGAVSADYQFDWNSRASYTYE